MKKEEFMKNLKSKIHHLSKSEQTRILSFYEEMIADKIESGMTEDAAIDSIQLEDFSHMKNKDTMKIVCYIICSPIIFMLYLAGFILALSFYIVIGSLFLLIACAGVSSITGIVFAILYLIQNPTMVPFELGYVTITIGLAIYITLASPTLIRWANRFTTWLMSSCIRYGKECIGYEK